MKIKSAVLTISLALFSFLSLASFSNAAKLSEFASQNSVAATEIDVIEAYLGLLPMTTNFAQECELALNNDGLSALDSKVCDLLSEKLEVLQEMEVVIKPILKEWFVSGSEAMKRVSSRLIKEMAVNEQILVKSLRNSNQFVAGNSKE